MRAAGRFESSKVVAGEPIPLDADLTYRLLVLGGALLGLVLRSRRATLVHAIAMLALMGAYLFDVYATVPA